MRMKRRLSGHRIEYKCSGIAAIRTILTVTVALIPGTASLAGADEYTMTNLGIPPGADSVVGMRMNNAGHVAGHSLYYGQLDSIKGWIWTPDQGFTMLPTPPGMPWDRFAAKDISDSDIVAGDGGGDSGPAWRYENGQYTIIELIGGTGRAKLGGVNEAGDIAGAGSDGSITTPDRAFLDINSGPLMNLTPGDSGGRATDLNNVGQVCGYTQGPMQGFGAFRWDEENGIQLLGSLGLAYSFANGMNDAGQVVGRAQSASGNTSRAWIYTDGIGQQQIPAPSGELVEAASISNQGHVVGTTHRSGPDIGWLWTPEEGIRTLHELFDFVSLNISTVTPRDINDAGQILVLGYDGNVGEWRTILLTPVVSQVPGDLDGDGTVGVTDLLILLGDWGPCPPKGDCPADLDGDGSVGVKDLLILLGNWG